ncbi:MAG: AAA family ATPase [Firmicutes bacterium]|nr:AAA family ATPase [Bacillota bacterium]
MVEGFWAKDLLELTLREYMLRREITFVTGRCFTGMTTGISILDAMINGISPGSMVVVGGQPGVGKTAIALQIATATAESDAAVIYCFGENKLENLHIRMICQHSNLSAVAYTRGLGDINVLKEAGRKHCLAVKNNICFLKIDKEFSVKDIKDTIGRYRSDREPDKKFLVVVDYLQKLAENRRGVELRAAVAGVSAELQRFAGDEKGVGILLISSLSRAAYYGDKASYGFKESGDIDYDADVAINLVKSANPKKPNVVELVVIKNRFGSCGNIELVFDEKSGKFLEPKKK